MKILAVRSVPLGKETRDAWGSAGVRFARRTRKGDDISRIVRRNGYDAVLSLGSVDTGDPGVCVFNDATTIRAVSNTAALRRTLNGEGMPPEPEWDGYVNVGPHWHKYGGWGGRGVTFHDPDQGWTDACSAYFGDIQTHIEGTEYRVNTVGDMVVQAARKVNCEWVNNRHYFDYEWCGVEGIRRNGIIPLLKSALEHVPNSDTAVLGWDVIVAEDAAYIIESNTSPGVKEPTARRIVDAKERIVG